MIKTLITTSFVLWSMAAICQAPRKLTQAQGFQLQINQQSTILLPPGYNPETKYPVVIFLPFTGGTGQDLFNGYAYQAGSGNRGQDDWAQQDDWAKEEEIMDEDGMIDITPLYDSLNRMPTQEEVQAYFERLMAAKRTPVQQTASSMSTSGTGDPDLSRLLTHWYGDMAAEKGFIAMILPEPGSTKDHSWEGFEACIHRYEQRILADLEVLSNTHSIDQGKVILTGFSLGGDVSWAISQRYPETFRGAVVAGTRCGYSEKGMMDRLAAKKAKFVIGMGEYEAKVRMDGARNAENMLKRFGISHRFMLISQDEHAALTLDQFKEAIDFVLH